jgi:glycerol-3-phosphate acyltransferase PlsY
MSQKDKANISSFLNSFSRDSWRVAGGLLAVATLPVHWFSSAQESAEAAAWAVAIIGAIYVVFAAFDGRKGIIGIEAGVAALFALAAYATVSLSPWIAVAAFVVHGLWDLAHDHGITTKMPRWYIPMCAFYDWVFAIGLTAIWVIKAA